MTTGPEKPFQWQEGDLRLNVHIQPRAKTQGAAGVHGGRIRLRLAAPPVDDKANRGLIAFLAGEFRVPKAAVTLISGRSSRRKAVVIHKPVTLPDWFRDLADTG